MRPNFPASWRPAERRAQAMSGSLADHLADTAFQLAEELDLAESPRPAKRARVSATVRPHPDRLRSVCPVALGTGGLHTRRPPSRMLLRLASCVSPRSRTVSLLLGPSHWLSRERSRCAAGCSHLWQLDGPDSRANEHSAEAVARNRAEGEQSGSELTGTATRRSLHEREGQLLPAPSSSFDDWITMVIKVPTAIEPGAVCKIFSPDGRAHFVTVPTSLPPGGSFIKALPKAYTEEVLKTLDRSEMKQWLRHRLEVAGQAEQHKYDTLSPSRQELLRTCVQWLRDAKAKVLQEAAAAAAQDAGGSDAPAVAWQLAWSGTWERQYWYHPVSRATVWERPSADGATQGKVDRPSDTARRTEHDAVAPPAPPPTAGGGAVAVPAPGTDRPEPDMRQAGVAAARQ